MAEDTELLTTEELQLSNEDQARLRIARKTERENEALKLQIKDMERKSAIERAGVPEHPARDVVFANYDGPLEGDSIREYALKMGIVAQESLSTGASPQEIDSQRQILNAGGGAPAPTGDIDLAVALRNAKSQGEVLGIIGEVAGQPGFKNRDGLIGILPGPI